MTLSNKITNELKDLINNKKFNENLVFCYQPDCTKVRYHGEWHNYRELTPDEESFLSSGLCPECLNKTMKEVTQFRKDYKKLKQEQVK